MAKRSAPEVNAGSMADIAFLLLIFFLVTTTILNDKGILVKLPRWEKTPPPPERFNPNNVLTVLVNGKNELLVENERMRISNLKDQTKEFIANPNQLISLPSSPKKAIISLKNDRSTSYETYLSVYNELKAAYNELRDEEAFRIHGKPFVNLSKKQQNEIKNKIPLVISEAEPTDYLESNESGLLD